MTSPTKSAGYPRIALVTTILMVVGLAPFAISQITGPRPPTRHFEYVHQEVLANALTQSMNDLDAQGWDIFQVVPSWQVKNDNGDSLLVPRAYEIFGRRSIAPK